MDQVRLLSNTGVDAVERPDVVGLVDVVRTLWRWVWIVGPLMVLTVFLTISLTDDIQPEYTAEVSVLLVGPNEVQTFNPETGDVDLEEINPLTNLGGSLSTVAQVVVFAISDGSVTDLLDAEGLSTDVQVGVADRSPIILVIVTDIDPQVAASTADRMVRLMATDLEQRQDGLGAPESQRITSEQINQSTVGQADYGSRSRVRIAFALVGIALSIAAGFFLEGLRQLRNQKEAEQQAKAAREHAERMSLEQGLIPTLMLVTGQRRVAEQIANQSVVATKWTGTANSDGELRLYSDALSRARAVSEPGGIALERPLKPFLDVASEQMWRRAGGLPIEIRETVALVYISRFTVEESALILNLTLPQIRQNLERATEVLDQGGDPHLFHSVSSSEITTESVKDAADMLKSEERFDAGRP